MSKASKRIGRKELLTFLVVQRKEWGVGEVFSSSDI